MTSNVSIVSKTLYQKDGFARIESLTTPEDIERIRSLLDPLFDRFESMGPNAVDLAGPREPGAPLRSPEINEAVHFAPELRKTLTFARCQAIASHLLGVPAGYVFDHAIFKPPHNNTSTAWHQDEGYNHGPIPLRAVHFWIPLQPVNNENGCMWFVPGSHRLGLVEHYVANTRSGGASRKTKGVTIATNSADTSTAVACPLEVGGATAHTPLTLHYTGPNQSDAYRKAWILHFGAYGKLRNLLHPKCVVARLRA